MGNAGGKQPRPPPYDSPASLAAKLAPQRQHALVAFLAPHCGLCSALRPALNKVCSRQRPWARAQQRATSSPPVVATVPRRAISQLTGHFFLPQLAIFEVLEVL